jgi:hypothetical protein
MSSLSWHFIASLNHVSGLGHSVGVSCITDSVDVLLLLSSICNEAEDCVTSVLESFHCLCHQCKVRQFVKMSAL